MPVDKLVFTALILASFSAYAEPAATAVTTRTTTTVVVPQVTQPTADDNAMITEQDMQELEVQMKADGEQVQSNVERSVGRVAGNVRDSTKSTGQKLREWWLTPAPEKYPTPVASSYCYHVLQDILCYRQPMPGWEHRLAGYQGTYAVPPPPAIMQPLPKRNVDGGAPTANRMAAAQPVFVNLPPDEKKPEASDPVSVDAAHENLPDPALAPQL
jgi:hypothetical protein